MFSPSCCDLDIQVVPSTPCFRNTENMPTSTSCSSPPIVPQLDESPSIAQFISPLPAANRINTSLPSWRTRPSNLQREDSSNKRKGDQVVPESVHFNEPSCIGSQQNPMPCFRQTEHQQTDERVPSKNNKHQKMNNTNSISNFDIPEAEFVACSNTNQETSSYVFGSSNPSSSNAKLASVLQTSQNTSKPNCSTHPSSGSHSTVNGYEKTKQDNYKKETAKKTNRDKSVHYTKASHHEQNLPPPSHTAINICNHPTKEIAKYVIPKVNKDTISSCQQGRAVLHLKRNAILSQPCLEKVPSLNFFDGKVFV